MTDVILDASAILAYLNDEPGAEKVHSALSKAAVSTVNEAEVVTKLAEAGHTREEIEGILARIDLTSIPFEQEHALAAGLLRPPTKRYGLSLGDRACLALASSLDAIAYTVDRRWAEVKNARVEVLR